MEQSSSKTIVSRLLHNTVIFIHRILRNRFRNAALTSRNIPGMRRITGQTVRNRLHEINTCSKTCPETLSKASKIAISKAAHLAASTETENRELELGLRRRRDAPVNHRQLAQALQEEWYAIHVLIIIRRLINSMIRICHYVIAA